MINCRLQFDGTAWCKDVELLVLPGPLDCIIDDDDYVADELRRLRPLQVEHYIGSAYVGVIVDNGDDYLSGQIPKRIEVTPEMFAASGWGELAETKE